MKKNLLILTLTFFIIALLPIVNAENVTEAHGVVMVNGGGVTETKGLAFTVNQNVSGLNITQGSSGNATRAYISDSATPTTPIATATFSGTNAVFPFGSVNLTSGTKYYFMIDSSGVSYISYNEGGSSINNQGGTFGNWTGCYYGGSVRAVPCVAVNVVSIVLSNDTILIPESSINFQGQTPSDNAVQYVVNNNNFTINTTVVYVGGTIQTSHYLYNSTYSLVAQNNQSSGSDYNSSFSNLNTGVYYFNASYYNTTSSGATSIRTIYIYNLTTGTINLPSNASNLSNNFQNFTWTNTTVTPSGTGVTVNNFTISIYNLTGSQLFTLINTAQLNLTNFNIYNLNLSTGTYLINLLSRDSNGNSVSVNNTVFLTRNTIINITAINALGGGSITNFSGWVYHAETGLNVSYSTTTGQSLVDFIMGNVTAYIDAPDYSLISNLTLSGFNVSSNQYNKQFSLYQTNTLNITFYDEANPTVLLTGINITLDLISSVYANSYYTTNGTMYLSLLTPADYTLRYSALNYVERFYSVTVTNRSFQSVSLYLINSSVARNLTINVIDDITNPVEGAEVQVLKYNLATNTYILQEIMTTNVVGEGVVSVTYNDEYYKFIVLVDGEVVKITDPSYITESPLTLQITIGSEIGEDYFDYYNFYKDLTFNTATDSFRLNFVDGSGVSNTVCLDVSRIGNFSETLLTTTCDSAASGTILISVNPINGTTYKGYAYFLNSDGVEYFIDSEYYTYPSSNIFGSFGLWLQVVLTTAFVLSAVVSVELAMILTPLSLILGYFVGLNSFSLIGLIPLQIIGFILFLFIIKRKR